MSVIYGLDNVTPEAQGGAVALGVFDGVHWGHRAIFEQLTEAARGQGIPSVALTFETHPAELLAPASAPCYITTLEQRLELIGQAGVEWIVVARFDQALAGLSQEEFLRRILHERLKAKHVVVGSNFRFGKGRKGDVRYLAAEAPKLGMRVTVVPSVIVDGGPVSSTRVRTLISRGDVSAAAKLLGRRFTVRGKVVPGKQVGRALGFPTANIEILPRQLSPARGVYAVEVPVGGSTYGGVCNIGRRPTFGGGVESIEVHLMDFEGDLYGETLDVEFCRRLRDEMAFDSSEKLAEQIRADLRRANCGGGS